MIVAMKKAAVIVQGKDSLSAVSHLRKLGLMHIEHQKPPCGGAISALQQDLILADSALALFDGREPKAIGQPAATETKKFSDWKHCANHVVDISRRIQQLEEYSRTLLENIDYWKDWGDFDPGQFQELERKGVYARLYQIPEKLGDSLPPDFAVKKIFSSGGFAHCLVVCLQNKNLEFKQIPMPKLGVDAMRHRLAHDNCSKQELKNELNRLACYRGRLAEIKKSLEKELESQQALAGMGREETLEYLVGYIPEESGAKLTAYAGEQKWGLKITDPAASDSVPTLLRNPKWVSLVSPVLRLLGITPGYRELDVSVLFMIFFSLFFGMLIGDAGYGLVYLLLTLWLQRKNRNKPARNVFVLFYVLSGCAIIWGILTGTFFGQTWLANKGVRPLAAGLNDGKLMQGLCFFLGALHLSVAHFWRSALKFPSLSALADVGWICVLWTAFLLAKTLILSDPFPSWGKWLIIAGVAQVVLFTNPQRNILKALGSGLGAVALSLMNNFTDVVSYVRLFAVGLATVAIAETTNTMAGGLGTGAAAIVIGVLIAVIGHALNIVLGPMSVLVHGVRLNVLEFSGHAGVTWSGRAYQPLKE